jgi:hypothetical protein
MRKLVTYRKAFHSHSLVRISVFRKCGSNHCKGPENLSGCAHEAQIVFFRYIFALVVGVRWLVNPEFIIVTSTR